MTTIAMDRSVPRAPDAISAPAFPRDEAYELTGEELALIAGGGFWPNLWRGVEHLGQDVEKGMVAGAITGAVGGAFWEGVGAAPGAVVGSVVGAVQGALNFLNI